MKKMRGQKVGVHGGRSWHLASGRTEKGANGIYSEMTLCGKSVNERWSPGYANQHPGVCRKCREANES